MARPSSRSTWPRITLPAAATGLALGAFVVQAGATSADETASPFAAPSTATSSKARTAAEAPVATTSTPAGPFATPQGRTHVARSSTTGPFAIPTGPFATPTR